MARGRPVDLEAATFQPYEVSPDGAQLLYVGPFTGAPVSSDADLHAAAIDGGSTPIVLNDPLGPRPVGDVLEFQISQSGSHVVYAARQDDISPGVYTVPLDGHSPPLVLAPTGFRWFATSSIRTQVVFRTSDGIYVAPTDGSSPPLFLDHRGAEPGIITDDEMYARLYDARSGDSELYGVALDGSVPAVKSERSRPSAAEGSSGTAKRLVGGSCTWPTRTRPASSSSSWRRPTGVSRG